MILYDGGSVDWVYDGWKTVDQMQGDPRYARLLSEPCVLYDNGNGKSYRYEPLADLAARWAVPQELTPEEVFAEVSARMAGTYKAPGVAEVEEKADAAQTAAQTASETAETARAAADEAKVAVADATSAAQTASEAAATAQTTADEAKAIAEQAGTDPQLAALATMQVATMDLTEATSTDCAGFRDYWPEWQPDTEYKYQQPLRYKGLYYRASKALTSSATYPPDTAGESEYYPVEVAPDGVIVYRTCHGQYDQVQAGETRHYPDAEGPVYRAKVDTAYDPDTVPGNWELVE